MKKITFILFFFSAILQAQNNISVTADGISSVVNTAEGKTAGEIYVLAKDLVLKMYSDPKHVIKVDEESKLLRFAGFKKFKGGISSEGIYNYTCEIEFRDGRYKISFFDVYLDKGIKRTYVDLFNKDGELRKMDFYKNLHANFTVMLNEVNDLFKDKIDKKLTEDKW